jgi:hypothetical protein
MPQLLSFWMYASSSRIAGDIDAEIERIVAQSRRKNKRLEITGAMIRTGNRFAQYVEGPSAAIAALRDMVMADPRHHDIVTLEEGTLSERRFAGWSLAYAGAAAFMERSIVLAQSSSASSEADRERLMRTMEEFERQSVIPPMTRAGS